VKQLPCAINSENYDRMKSLTNDLQQALMQVGSAVYSQSGSTTGAASSSSNGRGDDVIDADFVESKYTSQ